MKSYVKTVLHMPGSHAVTAILDKVMAIVRRIMARDRELLSALAKDD